MIEESNLDYGFSQVVNQSNNIVTPPKKYLNAWASTYRVATFNPEGIEGSKISPLEIENQEYNSSWVCSKFKKNVERADPKPKKCFSVLSDENQYTLLLKETLYSEDKPKIIRDAFKKEKKFSVFCKNGLLYDKCGYPTDPFAADQRFINLS